MPVYLNASSFTGWSGWIPTGPTQIYVWKRGALKPTPLPNVPGPVHSFALGFNDRGDYYGRWDDGKAVTHGFIAFRK